MNSAAVTVEATTKAASRGFDEPDLHTHADHDNGEVLVVAVANPTKPDNYGVQISWAEMPFEGVSTLVLTEDQAEFLRMALNRGKRWRRSKNRETSE